MTARTCPVHGEYSATGACRWCEPSGADQSTITLPLMCICKTCLRSFEAPIPLTSLECPECRAKSQPAPLSKGVSLPGLKGLWQKPDRVEVNEAGVPTYTFILTEKTKDAYVYRLEWTEARLKAARLSYDVLMLKHWHSELAVAEEADLLSQHAALRWERVARRWGSKRGPLTWGDLLERLTRPNPLLQDAPWKEPTP